MTKTEFVAEVAGKLDMKKATTEKIVDTVFETIFDTVIKESTMKIGQYGSLNIVTRKARVGHNPRTKEKISIPEKKTITFKISPVMKSRLNED